MIDLTRLNGNPIVLNCDLIKIAEASPDTMLTLINGEKLIVKEKLEEVKDRVIAFKLHLLKAVDSQSRGTCTTQHLLTLSDLRSSSEALPAPEASHFEASRE
jgi:flagellar protein FlbD